MRKNTHSDRSTATFNTVITIFFAVLLAQTAAVYILSGNIVCLFVSAGVMLLCAGDFSGFSDIKISKANPEPRF